MFSDKMDAQLHALQAWKRQLSGEFASVTETLDMVIKWITWMLFNTNTQVWKGCLDVLGALLRGLTSTGSELTDREASVLIPNMIERSGHNMQAIRESMMGLLRQLHGVYPRIKMLPMLIHGLTSKNKRSAACCLRCLGDMDRHTALALSRSKDLTLVIRFLDDKDAESRRSSQQVLVSLSHYVDCETFNRVIHSLPKSVQQSIRVAASRPHDDSGRVPCDSLVSENLDDSVVGSADGSLYGDVRAETETAERGDRDVRPVTPTRDRRDGLSRPDTPTRLRQPTPTRLGSPNKAASRLPSPSSPTKITDLRSPVRDRSRDRRVPTDTPQHKGSPREAPKETPKEAPKAPPKEAPKEASKETPKVAPRNSVLALASQLSTGSDDEFKAVCEALAPRVKKLDSASIVQEAPKMAEALLLAMQTHFGSQGSVERCWPLVAVLEEFCGLRECIRPLPERLLKSMLRELLRNLDHHGWTRRLKDGTVLLRKMNLACVMLLNSMNRSCAIGLILELGILEGELVSTSLVVKCLRKTYKGLGQSRNVKEEVRNVMDALYAFVRLVDQRLNQRAHPEKTMDSTVATLMQGAREVAEAALQASPDVVSKWLAERSEGVSSEVALLLNALVAKTGVAEKENLPNEASADLKDASLRKRVALSPAKPAVLEHSGQNSLP